MKIQQLRTLLAVHECGSIQEASRLLHLSQPSLSRTIKELEAELEVPLLLRSHRGITLTEYGKHVITRARRIVEEERRVKEEIEVLKGNSAGRVRIGVSPITPASRFVDVIARFEARHPNVRLEIEELRPVLLDEGLREGRLDLAITSHGQLASEGFLHQDLYRMPSALVVRKGHPARDATCVQELLAYPWLLPDRLEQSPVMTMFSCAGAALPQTKVCSSLVMYSELAARTDAISFWSLRHLELEGIKSRFDILNIRDTLPEFKLAVISRDRETLSREASALREDMIYCFHGRRETPDGFILKLIES